MLFGGERGKMTLLWGQTHKKRAETDLGLCFGSHPCPPPSSDPPSRTPPKVGWPLSSGEYLHPLALARRIAYEDVQPSIPPTLAPDVQEFVTLCAGVARQAFPPPPPPHRPPPPAPSKCASPSFLFDLFHAGFNVIEPGRGSCPTQG